MKKPAKINCDTCDWTMQVKFEDIGKWKKATCPQCHSVIVNTFDLFVWRICMFFIKIGVVEIPDIETSGNIHINTSSDEQLITIKRNSHV